MKNKVCCWVLAIFGIFVLLAMLGGGLLLFAVFHGAGDKAAVKEDSYLLIELTGRLDEYRTAPRIGLFPDHHSPTLSEALGALQQARTDTRIKGVLLKPSGTAGFAGLRELRDALRDFRRSGKPVYAYLEVATDRDYYLASVADTIVMVPSSSGGMVMLGLGIAKTYLAQTFDKVGLKFNVLHVGEFKGAWENLARERMSDSLRASLQTLLDDMFQTYTGETAADRHSITSDELREELLHGEHYLINAAEAQEKWYVDLALDWQDLRERLKNDGDDDLNTISAGKYVRTVPLSQGTKEIAVVYAQGGIEYSSGLTDPLGQEESIRPESFIKQLRELRENDEVAAVVLRVNSPGGSALASELILQEVKRLKAKKPVVVSMGNVAASGGYYISCAANYIFAQPNTVTGSIGVVGLIPTAEELYRKIEARVETVEKGKWMNFIRFDKDFTPAQEKVLLDLMRGIYHEFIARVADGRNLPASEVESVASGRVWTGTQALSRHLVDELGGVDAAIRKAEELAGVSPDEACVRHYPKEEDFLSFVIKRFAGAVREYRQNLLLSADERQILRASDYLNGFIHRREFIQMLAPIDSDF